MNLANRLTRKQFSTLALSQTPLPHGKTFRTGRSLRMLRLVLEYFRIISVPMKTDARRHHAASPFENFVRQQNHELSEK